MTTKERILQLFNSKDAGFEATSYDICETLGDVSGDTVDRNLKELVEACTLTREKKNATAGNRKVFYYRLPVSSIQPNPDVEVSSLNVGADGNLQGETVTEPEVAPSGPRPVYIVRKNDISPYVWARAQFKYAELLRPFDRSGRTFMQFGNTVVSIMLSDAPKERITEALESSDLQITFTVAENVDDAIEAMKEYTPNISDYMVGSLRTFAARYISRFTNEPVTTSTQPSLQAESELKSPMQRFADREYALITQGELLEVLSVLAKDYLERNPDTH